MCTICAALRPTDAFAMADTHATSAVNSTQYSASYDKIAQQLVSGYWDYNGESSRSFDISAGGSLGYDISALSGNYRYVAEAALQAWSDVSGIKFIPISPKSLRDVFESGDAGGARGNAATMKVGEVFHGNISNYSDKDWVRVTLKAGVQYTITLKDDGGGNPLLNTDLTLRDARAVAQDTSAGTSYSGDAKIFFTPDKTGTYFISTEGRFDTGRYQLELTDRAQNAQIVFSDSDSGAYSESDLVV